MKRKIFILYVLFMAGFLHVFAYDFEVNRIFYKIIDDKNHLVEVTFRDTLLNSYNTDSLSVPNHVTYLDKEYKVSGIGQRAFMGCNKLGLVILPNSITIIGNSAFAGCIHLKSIEIPNIVTSIDNFAFAMCERLETILLPDYLDRISDAIFAGCTSLITVKIPENVKYIGQKAFFLCRNLETIRIPKGVVDLKGCTTFMECKKIKYFEVNWEKPAKLHPLFTEDIDVNNCTLIVPFGLKTIYESADGWKMFKKIIERQKI